MKLPWWSALVSAVLGFLLCYWWPSPEPVTVEKIIEVPKYIEIRPDTLAPRGLGRLSSVRVRAETIFVTREAFDTARISRFCAARIPAPVIPDSGTVTPPSHIVTPLLPPFSGRYRDGRLELYATRSDGSGWGAVYTAHAPVTWAAGDTSVMVTSRRRLPAAVRTALKVGLCVGAGAAVNHFTGERELAAAGATGCVVGTQLR